MNVAVNQTRKPIQQDLRFYLPRWIIVFVIMALIQELLVFAPTSEHWWHVTTLVGTGLAEGVFGGLLFVFFQRFWNPSDSRVVRLRNYLAAGIITGIGSLLVMTSIYR